MLSILVPIYNCNIERLVDEIHQQAINCSIDFEIICFDDNSKLFLDENKAALAKLSNTYLITSKSNLGRAAARRRLCNASKYNWLLFLDADVLPKHNTLLQNYIDSISSGYDAFFGGFAYSEKIPNHKNRLRWIYGKKYEEVKASVRNLRPYRLIISANFLIKKDIFQTIAINFDKKAYGLDNYFASLLRQQNIRVKHLDNEVYHLGLETNKIFLKKTEDAIATLLWAVNNKKIHEHDHKLLSVFLKLKKVKLNYAFSFLYPIFASALKNILVSSKPNVYVLQLYKLFYICYKDLKPLCND